LIGTGIAGGLVQLGGFGDRFLVADSTQWSDVLAVVGLFAGGFAGAWLLLRKVSPAWVIDAGGDLGFPGRILGGLTLVVAPLLLLIGELIRIRFYYYYPSQLRAYADHPQLMTASYSFYALGLLLCWPAFLTLTGLIGARRRGWAFWGAVLAMTGLFVRLFHEGVNYLAFQMVSELGLSTALAGVQGSYTHWYVFYSLVFTDNLGWVVLAIGSYRAGRLGWVQCVGIAVMMAHWSGVLKGSSIGSVLETLGLCVALIPLGVAVLVSGTAPGLRSASRRLAAGRRGPGPGR
jgi:hypothetical protein